VERYREQAYLSVQKQAGAWETGRFNWKEIGKKREESGKKQAGCYIVGSRKISAEVNRLGLYKRNQAAFNWKKQGGRQNNVERRRLEHM
jgi:hypothetical protein